jgi:hypothetical protein
LLDGSVGRMAGVGVVVLTAFTAPSVGSGVGVSGIGTDPAAMGVATACGGACGGGVAGDLGTVAGDVIGDAERFTVAGGATVIAATPFATGFASGRFPDAILFSVDVCKPTDALVASGGAGRTGTLVSGAITGVGPVKDARSLNG